MYEYSGWYHESIPTDVKGKIWIQWVAIIPEFQTFLFALGHFSDKTQRIIVEMENEQKYLRLRSLLRDYFHLKILDRKMNKKNTKFMEFWLVIHLPSIHSPCAFTFTAVPLSGLPLKLTFFVFPVVFWKKKINKKWIKHDWKQSVPVSLLLLSLLESPSM